jgi:hypothetical protein
MPSPSNAATNWLSVYSSWGSVCSDTRYTDRTGASTVTRGWSVLYQILVIVPTSVLIFTVLLKPISTYEICVYICLQYIQGLCQPKVCWADYAFDIEPTNRPSGLLLLSKSRVKLKRKNHKFGVARGF